VTLEFKSVLKYLRGLAISVALGTIGGVICGSAILSLCALAGRIGTSGENYVGFWNWGLLLVGSMYGGPVGAVMGPVAYATIVRTIGFKQATIPAIIGTIIGGFAGSLISPLLGLPTGVVGFFVALVIARLGYSDRDKKRSRSLGRISPDSGMVDVSPPTQKPHPTRPTDLLTC
jgi:hypothetical protein